MMKSRRNSPDLPLQIPTPSPISSLVVESLKPNPKPTPHCHRFHLQEFDRLDQLTDHGIPNAAVYKVVYRLTGDLYASRVISADKPESARRFAYNHAVSMCKIRAANIVNYFDAYATDDDEVWIITEYVNGESLQGKQISDEGELSFIAEQILCGMCDMHARRRAHQNLCLANILIGQRVDSGEGKVGTIKMAEFGSSLSRWYGDLYSDILYMSPERIDTDSANGICTGQADDVWSLGVCMMELCMGRHPFHLQDPGDLARLTIAICRREPPQLPPSASSELRDFVKSCLQKDNTKRWTAAELLKHPFILGHKECKT